MFYIHYLSYSDMQPWFSPDGIEWRRADLPPNNVSALTYFNNRLFYRAYKGVWASDTEGNNWEMVHPFPDPHGTGYLDLFVNAGRMYAAGWFDSTSEMAVNWYSTADGDEWVRETTIGIEAGRELIAGNWYNYEPVTVGVYLHVRATPGESAFASYSLPDRQRAGFRDSGRRFYTRGWQEPGQQAYSYRYEDPPGSGQLHVGQAWSDELYLLENSYAVLAPGYISPVAGFPNFRPHTVPFGDVKVVGDMFTAQSGNILYQSMDAVTWEARELPGPFVVGPWGAMLLDGDYYTKISFNFTKWIDIPPILRQDIYWNGVHPIQPGTGQWPYRQRQSLGASGYPYRQRQNGGNTGSYPYRQRQRGL